MVKHLVFVRSRRNQNDHTSKRSLESGRGGKGRCFFGARSMPARKGLDEGHRSVRLDRSANPSVGLISGQLGGARARGPFWAGSLLGGVYVAAAGFGIILRRHFARERCHGLPAGLPESRFYQVPSVAQWFPVGRTRPQNRRRK